MVCRSPVGLPPQPHRTTLLHAEQRCSAQVALADRWFYEEPTMVSPSSLTGLVAKADAAAQSTLRPSFIDERFEV